MSTTTGQYTSFLVRVWTPGAEEPEVLGQVTHIGSHRSLRFRDAEQLFAFIRSHAADRPGGELDGDAFEGD